MTSRNHVKLALHRNVKGINDLARYGLFSAALSPRSSRVRGL
ncbi:hypothetical protein HanPSC8_Chr10g0423501 [Helianthus annuus]|nr:hypothetical protein HanPSC8_Chr10g0423501 [Helianthus annuus]